jgi:pimeloyl-ACP methyl ester carboxylesterase
MEAQSQMSEQIARDVGPDGIDVAYECLGAPKAPPVLLIMGLGAQMIGWDTGFCRQLAAHGLRVIRFDNRDVGRSTHAHRPYRLQDMAADAAGLLDTLRIDSAHVVGASMGGQIAQLMALDFAARVRTLTSVMSSTGNLLVGLPRLRAIRALAQKPPKTREQMMDHAVEMFRVIGSPAYPHDEQDLRERAALSFDRGFDVDGARRQVLAMITSGDRTRRLKSVRAPTLVIHGAQDPMCAVSGGRATAKAIPGAQLAVIDGMGHNLPPGLWSKLADLICAHAWQTESRHAA